MQVFIYISSIYVKYLHCTYCNLKVELNIEAFVKYFFLDFIDFNG